MKFKKKRPKLHLVLMTSPMEPLDTDDEGWSDSLGTYSAQKKKCAAWLSEEQTPTASAASDFPAEHGSEQVAPKDALQMKHANFCKHIAALNLVCSWRLKELEKLAAK
jgi:hypothetical protein